MAAAAFSTASCWKLVSNVLPDSPLGSMPSSGSARRACQGGDDAGLPGPRWSLDERDVRGVQSDLEREPLPVGGVREHVAHRLGDWLQVAAPSLRNRLTLDHQPELRHRVGAALDAFPCVTASADANLVAAQADEEVTLLRWPSVVLLRRRAKGETRRGSPRCDPFAGERAPGTSRRFIRVHSLDDGRYVAPGLKPLAVDGVPAVAAGRPSSPRRR